MTTIFPLSETPLTRPARVAVIGGGISGLGAAHRLVKRGHAVTVFESAAQLGGHARTVDVSLDGQTFPVDVGFLVFNPKTYPNLVELFADLDVPTANTDMSFSVSEGPHRLEWAGHNLSTVFAQKSNLWSPRFYRMLADILRFNRQATALALAGDASQAMQESLDDFLRRHRYGRGFRDHYLLPMAAAIWSCPTRRMRDFPIGSFVRFFHNHGLLQINDRPPWLTVAGSSREYVNRLARSLPDVRLGAPVERVLRRSIGDRIEVSVATADTESVFDHVVLACHSDQSLRLLADASPAERQLLGGVPYQPNQAWLHTDTGLMPARRSAWAAWNYLSNGDSQAPNVSITYWLNQLQPLPFRTPLLLSLNPLRPPQPDQVLGRFDFEHPILDLQAREAVQTLAQCQGARNTWFAGAWLGFGFHEDGLRSGLEAADALAARTLSIERETPLAALGADNGDAREPARHAHDQAGAWRRAA